MRPASTAASFLMSLLLTVTACNGHLDFGVPAGAGGNAGGAACAGDSDCGLSVLHCDLTGSKTCVACVNDTHCTTTGFPHCEPTLHRCVACVVATDCAASETCVAGRCATTCQDDTTPGCPAATSCQGGVCSTCGDDGASACVGLAGTPFCLEPSGRCVGCRTDADCSGAQPRCDAVSHTCVQCASGGDCPGATPFCDPRTGTCVAS
jgi:hypothetical protein